MPSALVGCLENALGEGAGDWAARGTVITETVTTMATWASDALREFTP